MEKILNDVNLIKPRLVNRERNKGGDYVFVDSPLSDLIYQFHYKIDNVGVIKLTNQILEAVDITLEDILSSGQGDDDVFIQSMGDFFNFNQDELMQQILIVTNTEKYYGAEVAFRPDVARANYEKCGDYYILPSSVHEVLIVPVSVMPVGSGLLDMVRQVNASCVDAEDYLSDAVYLFDGAKFSTCNNV